MLCSLALICAHIAFTMEQPSIKSESNYPPLTMNDSLWILYANSYKAMSLYIDKAELPASYIGLKTLFDKNNLIAYDIHGNWTNDDWKKTYSFLQSHKIQKPSMINLNELSDLLKNAKLIVKSFLANDNELLHVINEFMQKPLDNKFNRLFTYAYLRSVIKAENLTHILLPQKILVIQDKNTELYMSNKEAQKIIDDTLKIYVYSSSWDTWSNEVSFAILFNSDQYELKFFAHKEAKAGRGLSASAWVQLGTLCKKAPFDVGDDNIFWNTKGDAIIIDTEYRGETVKSACPKLYRYPTDPSL